MLSEAEYDVLRIVAYGVLVLAGLQGRRDLADALTERMAKLMEGRRNAVDAQGGSENQKSKLKESENANEGTG